MRPMISLVCKTGAAVCVAMSLAGAAQAQNAIPDPMATMANPLPNPMGAMTNPAVPVATSGDSTSSNPMVAPVAPNPMPAGGGLLNPMVQGAQPAEQDFALREDLGNLPDTAGVEDTYYMCTACHSAATFAQQRLTDARWDYLWDWMISDQNMPDYGPEARESILAYLKTHFSSER
ncbi:MAG: hypothetical protein KI785_14465 [Devosiaceae bacterium]|nr:hypothetical protein [Devosiaceae bacterium MH13]